METHTWGRAAKFFQMLGFELEFDTGRHSGQLRNGDGPYIFIAEIPEDQETHLQVVLKMVEAFHPDLAFDVVTPPRTPTSGPRR